MTKHLDILIAMSGNPVNGNPRWMQQYLQEFKNMDARVASTLLDAIPVLRNGKADVLVTDMAVASRQNGQGELAATAAIIHEAHQRKVPYVLNVPFPDPWKVRNCAHPLFDAYTAIYNEQFPAPQVTIYFPYNLPMEGRHDKCEEDLLAAIAVATGALRPGALQQWLDNCSIDQKTEHEELQRLLNDVASDYRR
jgi:hypothetical protein